MSTEGTRTVTLPRKAWIAAAIFALVLVGLLTGQFVSINAQLGHVARQDRNTDRLTETSLPAVRDARPLLERARADYDEVRAAARRADGLVRRSRPLVEDLTRYDAPRGLAAAGDLALALAQDDRLVSLVDRLAGLTAELEAGDRLVDLVDRARGLLSDLERTGALEEAGRLRRLAGRLVRLQAKVLRAQHTSLAVQRESLAVQKQTLEHVRNLDRRTGGDALPPR